MTPLTIRHGYDMWSEQYDRSRNFLVEFEASQQGFREEIISKHVRKRQRALDIGCGTGRHLPYLETVFESVIGIDVSSGMLRQARLKIKKSSTQLIESDFLTARLDGMFDFIHCSLALMHFGDTDAFFSKIARLLSPGGTLYLVDAPEEMLRAGSSPNFDVDGINFCVDYQIHRGQDLYRALLGAGLIPVIFRKVSFQTFFPSALPKYQRYRERDCLLGVVAKRSVE